MSSYQSETRRQAAAWHRARRLRRAGRGERTTPSCSASTSSAAAPLFRGRTCPLQAAASGARPPPPPPIHGSPGSTEATSPSKRAGSALKQRQDTRFHRQSNVRGPAPRLPGTCTCLQRLRLRLQLRVTAALQVRPVQRVVLVRRRVQQPADTTRPSWPSCRRVGTLFDIENETQNPKPLSIAPLRRTPKTARQRRRRSSSSSARPTRTLPACSGSRRCRRSRPGRAVFRTAFPFVFCCCADASAAVLEWSGGMKGFAKRSTWWDMLFMGIRSIGRDQGLLEYVVEIIFRFINLFIGLFRKQRGQAVSSQATRPSHPPALSCSTCGASSKCTTADPAHLRLLLAPLHHRRRVFPRHVRVCNVEQCSAGRFRIYSVVTGHR